MKQENKIKLKYFNKFFFYITLVFIFVSGLWALDIGASGMISEAYTKLNYITQGLGFIRTPVNQYHLGLLLATIVFMISICLNIIHTIKSLIHEK